MKRSSSPAGEYSAVLLIYAFCSAVALSSPISITQYSDAQCPCSAQFVSDIKNHFLDDIDFSKLVDFNQYFSEGYGRNDYNSTCIHGKEECVGHKFFLCAQNMTSGAGSLYRASPLWLDFQYCSYGPCNGCAAIRGPQCPCTNYTTFPLFEKNTVMQDCATKLGLDWDALKTCATGPLGESLLEASAQHTHDMKITYGVDGLPVVVVQGTMVKTKEPIPIVCGPVPKEVLAVVCEALPNSTRPAACTKDLV